MGWGQEAYDAECAAIARALQVAATRSHVIGAVTIFRDAQAAIWRMTSDELGLGQIYALKARKHIAALRAKEPGVKFEIRWCPSHQGSRVTRSSMNGPSSRRNRTPTEWSGFPPRARTARSERESSRSRDPSPT